MDGYNLFVSQVAQACEQFPKLHKAEREDGKTIIKGELDIIDRDGKFWESYEVEIHPSDEFPFRFPLVFETGGKIPRIADWHVYDSDHRCCIDVLPQEILTCQNGITISDFINNEALPYFFNQTHRRVEGYYKHGEYFHGLKGIFQFYDEHLKTNGNVRNVIILMLAIASGEKPGRTHDCFCGSRQKFRKCHKAAFEKLVALGKNHLKYYAFEFAKAAKCFDLYEKIQHT